ncbi:MAG: DUF362 domain-containing protein [Promethearchaeati archaeon SRVP18_Atabeyarchaeia-1]
MEEYEKFQTKDVGTGTMYERKSMRRFLNALYLRYHPESVLEAYCNGISGIPCIASTVLADRGCKVTLVNPNPKILKLAEDYWRKRGTERVEFRVGSVEKLPFESNTFDLVWNFAVVPKLENPMRALKELTRVSRNLVLVFSNNSLNFGFPFHQLYHGRTKSAWNHGHKGWMLTSNVKKIMRKAGLEVVKTGYVDVPPWPDLDIPIGQVVKGIVTGRSGEEGGRVVKASSGNAEGSGMRRMLASLAGRFEPMLPGFAKPIFGHHFFVLARKVRAPSDVRKPKVAVVRHKGDVIEETERGISLVGGLDVKGDTVFIKPNLCFLDTPESGRTSDIRIVEALVRMLRGAGKRVVIVESGNYDADVGVLFKELGYERLANQYGCELLDLKKCDRVKVRIANHKFKFPKIFLKKDSYFISVAKLKTHVFNGISCSWKNQWGCIAQIEKRYYHPWQDEVLFYINRKIRPDLAIIDGVVGMGGVGPVDGHPIKTNVLLFGKDLIAVDSTASRILSICPRIVSSLTYASDKGAGEIDEDNIEIVGDNINKVIRPYDFIPSRAYRIMRLGLRIGRSSRLNRIGMLVFNVGNFLCPRDIHAHGQPSLFKVLRKSLTSNKWRV